MSWNADHGWSEWTSLGGKAQGAPAVVVVDGTTDVYARGMDNALLQKWWDGSKWDPSDDEWHRHDDGFELRSSPAVVAKRPDHRAIFARGKDGWVYQKKYRQTWEQWLKLLNIIKGRPGVVVAGTVVDLYVRARHPEYEDTLNQSWEDGQDWSDWIGHGDDFRMTSSPTVVASTTSHRDVYAAGPDGAVWHKWWDEESGWSAWSSIGGQTEDEPGVVIAGGATDVYVRGMDSALWQKWWDGSGWNPSEQGWHRHDDGFQFYNGPVVVSNGPAHRDVYVRGMDNAIWHKWYQG